MTDGLLKIRHVTRFGAPVHAVALSEDGQHLLVGTEHELRLTDPWGHEGFRRAHDARDMPFHAVALAPDMAAGLAVQRTGEIYRLEFIPDGEAVRVRWPDEPCRSEPSDVHSIAFNAKAGVIAIGHLGPALTVLDGHGDQRWRQHPSDHTPTGGKTWTVALSPEGATLFAGSSGVGRYVLGAMAAGTGAVQAARSLPAPITGLAPLPDPLGVAAALNERLQAQVLAFPADLTEAAWIYEGGYGERVTALAGDPAARLIALGTNTGSLLILDALTGERLAVEATLGSVVLSLSLAGGRHVAAGLLDGRLFYLEYTPPAGKGEMLL